MTRPAAPKPTAYSQPVSRHAILLGTMAGLFEALVAAQSKTVLRIGMDRFDAELLADVALQRPNGDRGVDAAATAGVLAGGRAHAAADRRERVGRARDEIRVFVAAFGDELDVATGVSENRAAQLAFDLGLPVLDPGQADLKGHAPLPKPPGNRQACGCGA
jgi:hypothetical protein